jgi:hypothetical protein
MGKKRPAKRKEGSSLHDLLGDFGKDYLGDSDRAAAIVAHAALEHCLRILLSVMLGAGESAIYLLGDDDRPGKLGFTDQCRLAHALGLIDNNELHDLKTVARIRNRFAHSHDHREFDKEPIKSLCEGLKILGEYDISKLDSRRTRYQFVIMCLSARITTELHLQAGTYDKLLKKHPELDQRRTTRIVRLQPKNLRKEPLLALRRGITVPRPPESDGARKPAKSGRSRTSRDH